ncbi:PHA/PHB synthase family protein [Microvirga tunisiensis]|uniref:Class I poly(R)-hydroxyalkanoic acid synthase n=1 Tax=Microvirga tunisiensis TaxID=2108360 RepID=A0A5N7MM39_9HYPH|nr:class I poly(R)-hydroxyalkanoic acid synthase [Microvirga tunisiensis]MPR09899.1 class I poly(R)-hydroxyalkanoic acid synthase [Microvirga tunisiensis]MPR28121.1 class I poly(R)-hydroxyalkanoic acid synthase [Microvirga tunisiensis]
MDKPYGEEKTQGPVPDFEELSRNMARFIEGAGEAAAAYLKPVQEGQRPAAGDASEAVKSLGRVAEVWMNDPQKTFEAQSRLGTQFLSLWASTLKRAQGEFTEPVAEPEPKDNRFKDPEWSENPIFDFLKQAYLISSRWAEDLVENAEGLDERTRHKAQFYLKQLSSALSPSNFLLTNPELIRETLRENGANLVRGMTMLAEDIEAGGGELKIRQSDPSNFKVGVNIATTPGKVIFRNDLIELIQYTPVTEKVLKRPLLIVPPWINKFYILDLNPEKSFIRWAVSQGLTVFCISWVNPAEQHAEKGFEHYMVDGIFAALDAIEKATGEKKVTAIGYCVGGTLLATTLAYMAAKRDKRVDSATFFTAQVDFTHAGDLKVFAGEEEVRSLEATMKKRGYLEGSRMANAFNMLRPNDLIWPYVVNVYMKGQAPFPFDLLYWNADSTRMPAANHAFYLRNCYLENKLAKGEMELAGVKLDLKKVKAPIFNLATKEDHIAPARSVFVGSKAFGGPVDYVLAGSGHIAGVVNSPNKPKYQFWTGGPVEGELEDWMKQATETSGSWWPYWFEWIKAQAPRMVAAREPGSGKLEPLCDAPGTYVLAKS